VGRVFLCVIALGAHSIAQTDKQECNNLLVRHMCLSDIGILWASKAAPETQYFPIGLELGVGGVIETKKKCNHFSCKMMFILRINQCYSLYIQKIYF
jgi:hypothetical protein